jgi:hypothetical protein
VPVSPRPATESTVSAWFESAGAIRELLAPEMRYRTPWGGDELAEAVRNAHHWFIAHPCPDPSIGRHLMALLDAYAEMPQATVGRVMELRDVIGHHAQAVSRRRVPRAATRSRSRRPL